ncbi:MAG TPA: hypothetical protein VG847_02865 [Chitinophagaceae bacterium]|nr:hypothetical protein [Chitinophagaceae bacterium]
MSKISKIALLMLFVCGIFFIALADRGGFIRKNKTKLNITPAGNLKSSIAFNLKSGITYKGSFFLNRQLIGNNMVTDAFVSFKKGNTIYILPYKQRTVIPQYTQQDGYKLIIRSRK